MYKRKDTNQDINYFIYGLYDPLTDELCYIGRTKNIKSRYLDHRTNRGKAGIVNDWEVKLRIDGLVPKLKILHTCLGEYADSVEKMLISRLNPKYNILFKTKE